MGTTKEVQKLRWYMLLRSQLALVVAAAATVSVVQMGRAPTLCFALSSAACLLIRSSRTDAGQCAAISRVLENATVRLPLLRQGLNNEKHRQAVQELVPWVVRAAGHAPMSELVRHSLHKLICCDVFTHHLKWAQSFDTLQRMCAQRLRALGNMLRVSVFESQNLGKVLGTYKPRLNEAIGKDGLRQQFLIPPACLVHRHSDELERVSAEAAYIHFLRMIALAIHGPFQSSVQNALQRLALSGRVSANGIKGYERMFNKIGSSLDHALKPFPRPASNIDVVRVMATFESATDLLGAFSQLANAFNGFAQFKNGFAWDADFAREQRSDLRIVLATVWFTHPKLPTIGQMRNDRAVRRLWDTYLETEAVPELVPRDKWRQDAQRARSWIESLGADQPIRMACEVQCMLRVYRDARHRMHEL